MMFSLTASVAALLLVSTAVSAAPASRAEQYDLGSLPASISHWHKGGSPVHPSTPYTMTITFEGRDMDGLSRRMEEIALSGGSLKWLTKQELEHYTAPKESDKAAVLKYFRNHGISENHIVAQGDQISVHTTVEVARKAFNTDLATFVHKETKKQVIRSSNGFKLPFELQDKGILHVSPLTDFAPRATSLADAFPMGHQSASDTMQSEDHQHPHSTIEPYCQGYYNGTDPRCWRNLYGFEKPKASSDNIIEVGVLGLYNASYDPADLRTYLANYSSESVDFKPEIITTPDYLFDPKQPDGEAGLDIQVTSFLVAPLKVGFYGVAISTYGFDEAFRHILSLPAKLRPGVLSVSYNNGELYFTPSHLRSECKAAQMLTSLGTTIVTGSGDDGLPYPHDQSGNTTCKTNAEFTDLMASTPSNCPYVLSAGGTESSGTNTTFLPEQVPDGSPAGKAKYQFPYWAGAGISRFWKRPAWQKKSAAGYIKYLKETNNDLLNYYDPSYRSIPDLSAFSGISAFVSHQKRVRYGGTSLSAPIVGSMIGLVNAKRREQGRGPVGWVHPVIYQDKAKSAFVDITKGGVYGCADDPKLGFDARPGFDFASGLGRPKYPEFAKLFL